MARWGNTAPCYIDRTYCPVNVQRRHRVWHWDNCKPLIWLLTASVCIFVVFLGYILGCLWCDQAHADIGHPELIRERLLANVIHAEARGESFTGKVAVGAVVMNRVADHRFPNSVRGVVNQPGQFAVSRSASYECYRAARAALSGQDPTNGAMYFWSKPDNWVIQKQVVAKIGGHTFAKEVN